MCYAHVTQAILPSICPVLRVHDLFTCMSFTRTCVSNQVLVTEVRHSTMDIDSIFQCLQHDMQQMTLTMYAVPVPPTNQGRVTRYTEYDVSRIPKATAIQTMRASAVHVHICSAGLCLFSLGRGGTRHAAKARLMAWASMAPLCSHHSLIQLVMFFPRLMVMGCLLRVLPTHVDNPVGLSLMPYCLGQHWLPGSQSLLPSFLPSFTHSLTPSRTHSLTHPPTQPPTQPPTHPLTHSLTHSLSLISVRKAYCKTWHMTLVQDMQSWCKHYAGDGGLNKCVQACLLQNIDPHCTRPSC